MAGNAQMIIDLDKKRMEATVKKDVAALNELIADDLVYTHSSARQDTKKSLIDAMVSGQTVYTGLVPSEVKAQDCGDAVVLTGICRISVMSGGKPNNFGVRFTDVYAKRGGKWQMVVWQSTKLPE
jgi:ketosteroid isomerase-like protein